MTLTEQVTPGRRRTPCSTSRTRASGSRSSPGTTRPPSPPSPSGSAWSWARTPSSTPAHRRGPGGTPGDRREDHRFRPGVAGAEAGTGAGAAAQRPRGRDDRGRRQRRPGAEGRRHRRRDGQRRAGHQGGRPAGAAGRQVLAHAVGAGRGPPGDRQRRAGGQPVRGEERDEPGRDHVRGPVHPAVPVPAPASHPGVGGDDRHPRVLPGARDRTSGGTSPGSCAGCCASRYPPGWSPALWCWCRTCWHATRSVLHRPPNAWCRPRAATSPPTSSAGSRRRRRRWRCCSPRSGSWWCCPGRSGPGRRCWSGRWSRLAALAFITPMGQSFFNFSLTPTTLWSHWRSAPSARWASRSSTAPNRRCGPPPRD